MENVFVLVETLEDSDAIREFDVVGVYDSIYKARMEMRGLVEEDPHDMIQRKGIFKNEDNYFSTNFNDGFLEYYIFNKSLNS